ncbi:VanZ family protein [Agromyces sp. LHK192]|uniref:VanZ family protein n=1 Tax=Agromyces sp. LHK192 TaxID=2498704 RepID=UPI000FD80C1B|nr:VanZ family protein [Agromyces sp. LHK192]
MVPARLLLVPYLVVLGLFVFMPGSDVQPVGGALVWAADMLSSLGVPFDAAYAFVEFTANIVLFVPLGLLLSLAGWHLPFWAIVLIGLVSTCVIEAVQLAIPGRYSTLSDVVANTLGTALGALAARWIGAVRERRSASSDRDRSRVRDTDVTRNS